MIEKIHRGLADGSKGCDDMVRDAFAGSSGVHQRECG